VLVCLFVCWFVFAFLSPETEYMERRLYEAAKGGRVDEVEEILRNNPDIDVNWEGNLAGYTPLSIP